MFKLNLALSIIAVLGAASTQEEDLDKRHGNPSKMNDDCLCSSQSILLDYNGKKPPKINEFYPVTIDGESYSSRGQFVIDSNPFTTTSTNAIFDRAKYLFFSNKTYAVPECHELSFTMRMSAKSFGIESNPFGAQVADPSSDPRLATGMMLLVDNAVEAEYIFFIANTKIYAAYNRGNAFPQPTRPLYFTNLIPVKDRKPSDVHNLSIKVNKAGGFVRWIIDGEEVFRLYKEFQGVPAPSPFAVTVLDGLPATNIFPENLQLVFGTVSLLDCYSPCNVVQPNALGQPSCVFPQPERGLVRLQTDLPYLNPRTSVGPAVFVDETSDPANKIFGQGEVVRVERIIIGKCKENSCPCGC